MHIIIWDIKRGVRPEESKVQVIKKMERPTTKKEVRSMTGYYKRFIQDYATKAEPLTELTKNQTRYSGQ